METKQSGESDDDVKKTYDVFICYSRKDLDVVKPIKEELEANGFSCWTDLDRIESGSNFTREIVKAIVRSSVFLFIFSDNSQNSQWAINELRFARRSNKKVVLVRSNDDAMSAEFMFEFIDSDITDWRRLEQRQKMLRDMHTWLGKTATRVADDRPKAPIPFIEKLVRHLADNSPHDIFISYSRKNKDLVLPIKEEIERTLGLRCWIDLSDIPCGSENFKRKVIPGIKQTRIAFLFFLTAESQASEYAMKEINFAKKRAKKRLILIRINDDEMTDEFAFDFQDADIIDWRQPEQKAKLLRDLRLWADEATEPHSPTATQKPSDESVKTQPEVSFVVCPICGRKNRPVDTFRCRVCGRDNLCLRHQDEATFLCSDCKTRTMHGGVGAPNSPSAFGDTHKKVQLWENGPYWAETNIGAENPWDPGYYFWWGDTVGYKYENGVWMASDGSSSGFSFGEGNVPTGCKDNRTLRREGWITAGGVLAPNHDAAHVQWGGGWRMPTMQEIDELDSKCDWTWTTMNGVNGHVVRGRGDYFSSSIFLPAAGDGYGTSRNHAGSDGYYWSSVSYSDDQGSWCLYFFANTEYGVDINYRSYGLSVRPVQGFTQLCPVMEE